MEFFSVWNSHSLNGLFTIFINIPQANGIMDASPDFSLFPP
jgi:hypothetical protein